MHITRVYRPGAFIILPVIVISVQCSVLLDRDDYNALIAQPSLQCSWLDMVYNTPFRREEIYSTHDVAATIASHLTMHTSPTNRTRMKVVEAHGQYALKEQDTPLFYSPGGRSLYYVSAPLLTSADLLCFEYHAVLGYYDLILFWYTEHSIALLRHHTVDFLEAHFNMFILAPPSDIVECFNNKKKYVDWMVKHGMDAYAPRMYTPQNADIKFPVIVKPTESFGGRGVAVAYSRSELDSAAALLSGHEYTVQEAIMGDIEVSVNTVARRGKLLGMICDYIHTPTMQTIITEHGDEGKTRVYIHCSDLNSLVPLYSIFQRITEKSNYNGLACANAKVVPLSESQKSLTDRILRIKHVKKTSASLVATDFSQQSSNEYVAELKILEINPRIGGPLFQELPLAKARMLELYIDDTLLES